MNKTQDVLADLRGKVRQHGTGGLTTGELYRLRCELQQRLKTPADEAAADIMREELKAVTAEQTARAEARSRKDEPDW